MSMLLLIGLVQAQMDENGYVFKEGQGWIHKDTPRNSNPSNKYTPKGRTKRPYKK